MKKLTIWLLTVILLAGLLPASSVSAQEFAESKTPLGNSSDAKIHNIKLAAERLDGVTVGYGETFSFNDLVGARTEERGYKNAVNGRGSKVRGGGVAQVASTLYLALKQMGGDIEYVEMKTYGNRFTDGYVSSGKDAVVTDYKAGTDFRFINYYDTFTISLWVGSDAVYCSLESGDDGDWEGGWEENGDGDYGASAIEISGNKALKNNIRLCADSIYDTTLGEGDIFSFNDIVGPRTERYGYEIAINGRGVKVVGGGVAQVASALWLAVKNMDCIEIVERKTYGDRYNQSYVKSSNDAILTDYNDDTDFRFRYIGYGTLSIYTYVSDDEIICEVYEE